MVRLRGGLLRGFLVAAFLASICRVQAYTVIFEDPKTGERRERDGSEFTNVIIPDRSCTLSPFSHVCALTLMMRKRD
jgi:hypothetical protein